MVKKVALIVVVFIGLVCSLPLAESKQKQATPQRETKQLAEQKRSDQPTPPLHLIIDQQAVDAIERAIASGTEKAKAQHNPSPPDNSRWWFEFFIVVFNGILAIGVFLQIFTILYLKKSSDAAQKSAEIAERALIAGQRAFVSAPLISYVPTVDVQTGQIIGWNFVPTWSNTGDTPTRNFTNHVNLLSFEGSIPKDWDFPDFWSSKSSPEERSAVLMGIAPNISISGQSVGISVERIAQVIKGERSLYMWGWAKYNDVFPGTHQHITRFALHVVVGGDALNKDHVSFNFRFLPKYGCSDEECDYQGYGPEWIPRQMLIDRE